MGATIRPAKKSSRTCGSAVPRANATRSTSSSFHFCRENNAAASNARIMIRASWPLLLPKSTECQHGELPLYVEFQLAKLGPIWHAHHIEAGGVRDGYRDGSRFIQWTLRLRWQRAASSPCRDRKLPRHRQSVALAHPGKSAVGL